MTLEEYDEEFSFMSEKMLELLCDDENTKNHFASSVHLVPFLKNVKNYISVMGWGGPGMAARHNTKPLQGNCPWGVPVRLKNGRVSWWRILTGEGCPLPTKQVAAMASGDARGLMAVAWMAYERKALRVQDSGMERVLRTEKVKSFEFGMVRWSAEEITKHYSEKTVMLGYRTMPLSVTEWMSVSGVMPPENELSQGLLPVECNSDGDFKQLIETSGDEVINSKGLNAERKNVLKHTMAGNSSRSWYPVIRMQCSGDGDDDPGFVSCLVQLVIDWVFDGASENRVPVWLMQGMGVAPDPDFLTRLAAAVALLGEDATRRAIENRWTHSRL
jgi:hypothetical protein